MTVVYLDSVFLLNAGMDYLLFLATARLAGIPLRRKRYALAALAGGVYAAAVFLPGMEFLGHLPVKAAVGALLSLLAFGGEDRLLRLMLLCLLLACVLAGLVLAFGMLAAGGVPMAGGVFYTDISGGVLLAAATAGYILLGAVFRASASAGAGGGLLRMKICICGKTAEIAALRDSGNVLRDPVTGRGVPVVAWSAVRDLLPRVKDPAEGMEALLHRMPQVAPCLIPYRSVGTACGMLLCVRTDWTEIGGDRMEGLRIALSHEELGDGYAALCGGGGKQGG